MTVLEAEEMLGTGSTGLNAGGFRHQFSTAVNIELSKLSLTLLERFEEEFDQSVALNLCGYLFLLDAADDVAAFEHNVAVQHAHGVATRWLALDNVSRLAPQCDLSGIMGATFYDRDGLVDPSGVLHGYVRGARRAGVTVHTGARVTGARIRADASCRWRPRSERSAVGHSYLPPVRGPAWWVGASESTSRCARSVGRSR